MLQDRQCTYKVTMRHARKPLLQWKSDKYYTLWMCVCSLRYPICNTLAPYCLLWPVRLYYIFSTLSLKWRDCRKKFIEHKMCVGFSLRLLSETFLILRTERDVIKNLYWPFCKVPVILVLLQFFSTVFLKIFNYQIELKFFQWKPHCFLGTDKHTVGETWRGL